MTAGTTDLVTAEPCPVGGYRRAPRADRAGIPADSPGVRAVGGRVRVGPSAGRRPASRTTPPVPCVGGHDGAHRSVVGGDDDAPHRTTLLGG